MVEGDDLRLASAQRRDKLETLRGADVVLGVLHDDALLLDLHALVHPARRRRVMQRRVQECAGRRGRGVGVRNGGADDGEEDCGAERQTAGIRRSTEIGLIVALL